MVVEPSNCTFKLLMDHINEIESYNGGDQGYLNEIFTWWHRIPKHMNFLKHFWEGDEEEKKILRDGLRRWPSWGTLLMSPPFFLLVRTPSLSNDPPINITDTRLETCFEEFCFWESMLWHWGDHHHHIAPSSIPSEVKDLQPHRDFVEVGFVENKPGMREEEEDDRSGRKSKGLTTVLGFGKLRGALEA
ncbi:hypothetical protein L1887_31698 [Cichorium endivia]|nr:hypothetical protein L1887_31698 [Cichorium endivia]